MFATACWGLSEKTLHQSTIYGTANYDAQDGTRLVIEGGDLLKSPDEDDSNCSSGAATGVTLNNPSINFDAIYGKCSDGKNITLGNVQTVVLPGLDSIQCGRQTAHADYALVNATKHVAPDALFTAVDIRIAGLWEWSGAQGGIHFERDKGTGKLISISAEWDLEESHLFTLFEDEIVKISLRIACIRTGNPTSKYFTMERDTILHIELKDSAISIETMLDTWVFRMWAFLSFCMGFRGSISKVEFTDEDKTKTQYYASFGDGIDNPDFRRINRMPLPLHAIQGDIHAYIDRWLKFQGDIKRGTTVIIGLLNNNPASVIDSEYVSLAGAFEAISRDGRTTKDLDPARFQEIRNTVLEALGDDSSAKEWVQKKLNNIPPANFYAQELLKDLGTFAEYVVPDQASFLKDMRKIEMHIFIKHQKSKTEKHSYCNLYTLI